MTKCRFPDCPNTATKESPYCLPHDEAGQRIVMAMLNVMAPAPVVPPRTIWQGITIAIQEKEDAS